MGLPSSARYAGAVDSKHGWTGGSARERKVSAPRIDRGFAADFVIRKWADIDPQACAVGLPSFARYAVAVDSERD